MLFALICQSNFHKAVAFTLANSCVAFNLAKYCFTGWYTASFLFYTFLAMSG